MLDVLFGSLATLLAASLTYFLKRNVFLAIAPPVLVNAVVVGVIVKFCYFDEMALPLLMLTVGAGQLFACYGFGLPLYYLIKRNAAMRSMVNL